MRISLSIRILTLTLAIVMFVSGCGGQNVTKDASAASLLPNLPNYTVNNVLDIQNAIATVAGATAQTQQGRSEQPRGGRNGHHISAKSQGRGGETGKRR